LNKSRKPPSEISGPNQARNVLLITRVSTLRQAENDEGPLKNQLQRLRSYMDYRRNCGESWTEIAHIQLKGISGKNSLQSVEFQPAYELIRTGRVNTILCPDPGPGRQQCS
jgi:DNA invertase Pin-like site-specific DNA recombinase